MNLSQIFSNNSTAIYAASYAVETGDLTILFQDGLVYQYLEVSREIFDGLINSESVGRFFNTTIRNRYSFIAQSN